jgi:hypothetical protein
MIKFGRIAITLVSCISLSILGAAGVASAHPVHVSATGTTVAAPIMTPAGHDWCC